MKTVSFFVMPLKNVSDLTGLVNGPGTQTPWTITHEIGQKWRKRRVLVVPLKNGSVFMGLLNRPGTLKPLLIAHENSQKLR